MRGNLKNSQHIGLVILGMYGLAAMRARPLQRRVVATSSAVDRVLEELLLGR